MVLLFGNSVDADQMPHSAASDLGLHCLPFPSVGLQTNYHLTIFKMGKNTHPSIQPSLSANRTTGYCKICQENPDSLVQADQGLCCLHMKK